MSTNFAITGDTLPDVLTAMRTRVAFAVNINENFRNLNAGEALVVIRGGVVYQYDPNRSAATTVASEGVIISADDRVYVAAGATSINNVESFQQIVTDDSTLRNTRIGDIFLISGVRLQGGFAAYPNHFAIWTRIGWLFIPPRPGMQAYNEDNDTQYQYTRDSFWRAGFSGSSFGDNTILRTALTFPLGATVLEVGRNNPPLNPNDHACYIVGTNPTGDWAGMPNLYVYYFQGQWRGHFRAYPNATVWNDADGLQYRFNGTAWVTAIKQTTVESFRGTLGSTFENITIGAKEGWLLGSRNEFPKLIRSGDFVEIELHDNELANINSASDNDITAAMAANGEFALQSKTAAPDPSGTNYQMEFNLELWLMVGNQTTPAAIVSTSAHQGRLSAINRPIFNFRSAQGLKPGGGSGIDTAYTHDTFRPVKNLAPGLTQQNFTVSRFPASDRIISRNLQGQPDDDIYLAVVIDDVTYGRDDSARRLQTSSPDNIERRSDLSVSARNLNFTISYKYYRNTFGS